MIVNPKYSMPEIGQRIKFCGRPTVGSPVMYQQWRNLLFLHWEISPEVLTATLPPGLALDTFEGKAYFGIVPFFMQGVRPRFLPTVPGLSNFMELNLRTYVYDENGKPGIWFYSLEANKKLAVLIARSLFNLPYFDATMSATVGRDNFIDFRSQRKTTKHCSTSQFVYQVAGQSVAAVPGSLEFFLVERYVLFAYDKSKKQLYSGRVHHAPYALQKPELKQFDANIFGRDGFAVPDRAPQHVLACHGVDVTIFYLQKN